MQKLQLSIPEPCHENWQQMTPTQQGRFCNACAKEVIDFSTMTDIQVLNYFTNMASEKVCGRALPEQLERTLSRPEHPKKKIFWYWNYFVMFLMFFGKVSSAKAQGNTQVLTVADLNKIRLTNINEALAGRVGGLVVIKNKIISGKVTDKDGNPVSFASVNIKGTNTGVSADAGGAYSVRVNSNTLLIISGVGFQTTEVLVGSETSVNTILEKSKIFFGGEVVITGYMNNSEATEVKNRVAEIKIKDSENNKPISAARVYITKNKSNRVDTVFADNNGSHKIKAIRYDDICHVKIEADGYEPNEFTIDGAAFKDRKKDWEVLLRKKKEQRSNYSASISCKQTTVRIGGISALDIGKGPIYVVDGTIVTNTDSINPDDVDNITILVGPAATALFGPEGANGAIVITTKKIRVKNLDTVSVTAFSNRLLGQLTTTTCTTATDMGGMTKGITVKSTISDTLKMIATKITGAIKIYPNPVQRGQEFSIALKLKEAGLYQMQVTDATGRIVLQKQINANSKEVTEKIMADSRWSAGIYYVSIVNNKSKLISKTSFIVQ